jgi:hypothetical protein
VEGETDVQVGEIQEHHAASGQNHLQLEKASFVRYSMHAHDHALVQNSCHSSSDGHGTFYLHFEVYGHHHVKPRRKNHHFCALQVASVDDLEMCLENDHLCLWMKRKVLVLCVEF